MGENVKKAREVLGKNNPASKISSRVEEEFKKKSMQRRQLSVKRVE